MKTIKITPQWLTDDMAANGMTLVVLQYLSGTLKRLPKDLSWLEFITLWSIREGKFEQTSYFQKRIGCITMLSSRDTELLTKIRVLLKQGDTEKFFMKFLPFKYALLFCENFWACMRLMERRTISSTQKKDVLEKVAKLTATEVFNADMIIRYLEITKDIPSHQATPIALANQYLLEHPKELYRFKHRMDIDQVQGFCVYLETQQSIPFSDLLSIYERTRAECIPNLILKSIEKDGAKIDLEGITHWIFSQVAELNSRPSAELRMFQEVWFPVVSVIVEKRNFPINIKAVLMSIPKYDPRSPSIVFIIENLIAQAKTRGYGMSIDDFSSLYSYAKTQAVIDAFIEGKKEHPDHLFGYIVTAYELSGSREILEAGIALCIPTVKYAEEYILFFLDWLQKNFTDLYIEAKERMVTSGVIDTVWGNAKRWDKHKFAQLTAHFL